MSDLIDRQAAIDALRAAYWDKNIQSAKDDPCIVDAMTDWAIRQIKALPSAQLHTKGRWIGTDYDGFADGNPVYDEWKCSICGCVVEDEEPTWNFCPNCGADMRGEQDGKNS